MRRRCAPRWPVSADYLPSHGEQRNPSDYTPELSRRARGVDIWVALRTLGRRGVAELVERCCAHSARFARELQQAGAEVLNEVVLNQVLVSFGTPERTRAVVDTIPRDGTCWCGPTVWQGAPRCASACAMPPRPRTTFRAACRPCDGPWRGDSVHRCEVAAEIRGLL
jgi:hypothetical protein